MAGGPHSGGKAPVGAGVGVGASVPGADAAAVHAAAHVYCRAVPCPPRRRPQPHRGGGEDRDLPGISDPLLQAEGRAPGVLLSRGGA